MPMTSSSSTTDTSSSEARDALLARDGYYADLYRRQTLEEEIEEIA
jgi:hypothetical protein